VHCVKNSRRAQGEGEMSEGEMSRGDCPFSGRNRAPLDGQHSGVHPVAVISDKTLSNIASRFIT